MARRTSDNQTGRLWVEQGESGVGPIADVAPVAPIDKTYSFAVPEELAGRLEAGQRVRVPLGRKGRVYDGFCVGIRTGPWTSTLRPIHSLIDTRSYLNGELLELGRWIARHYGCPLGRTLNALVPESVRAQAGFQTTRYARLLAPPTPPAGGSPRVGEKQQAVLTALAASDDRVDVKRLLVDTHASLATLRAMALRGWIAIEEVRGPATPPDFDRPAQEPVFALNADQQAALERVDGLLAAGTFGVALLFGVSGSGKTEVYIRAMRRVLETGRQVILLVPEIALTTQLVARLACRFRDVAVIHSGLTGVARSLTWEGIATGVKKVVIGTRSAVFAPCPRLGLIVVDEEQEGSYKNLQAPRFHARDVAVKRAQLASIPLLLGSATPSLETWANCERAEHYQRIDLPCRIRGLPLPRVYTVDMREEYAALGQFVVLSRLMEEKLSATLERGEQAVLLINRRGNAHLLFCPKCRFRLECPNCHVLLVFHSATDQVLCHYCRHRLKVPRVCANPSCRAPLVAHGAGTQRVEEVLHKRFPQARVQRVDSDTMLSEPRYRKLIEDFEARAIDVVVGTQMIAKGLDFPFVSFVGVLSADAGLSTPDFRAAERLFQLITQVAGRAGRSDVPGEVVVQSMAAQTPAMEAAVTHDYPRFAAAELDVRRRLGFPPYARLTRLVLADAKDTCAFGEAGRLADRIRAAIQTGGFKGADVLGPQPCPLVRLRGRYRHELLLRAADPATMRGLLDRLRADHLLAPKVQAFVVDVDPVSLV